MKNYQKIITCSFALFLLTALVMPDKVLAHATPVGYEPENSAIVEKAPQVIKIHYSERVDLNASSIEVYGPDGSRIDNKDASVAPNDLRLFQVNIPDRGEGTYTVSWKVLSADDGHFSKGAFIFSVGKETGASINSADQFQVIYRSNIGEATTIFIELMGMGLLIALFLLHTFGLRPLRSNSRLQVLFTFDDAYRKRFTILFFVGVFLVIVGTLSYVVVKSLDLQTFQGISFWQAIQSFAPTVSGSFTLYRTGLAILLIFVFLISRKKIFDGDKGRKYWLFGMFVVMVLIALSRGRVSHAAASHFLPVFSVFIMFLQVFWKTFWFGGLVVLTFLLMPLAQKNGLKASVLISTSFSKLVSIALGFVGVSGAYIVWLDLKDPAFLLTSDWGIRFIVLSLIGSALVLVRLFHQLYVDRVGMKLATGELANDKYFKWFSYSLPLEFLISIALIFVTSFLVITTPPVPKQTIYQETATSRGTIITLAEHRFEEDKFLVSITDEKTGDPVAVKSATITLTNEEKGIGPIVMDTERRIDGAFVFAKNSLSPSGQWKVDVAATRPGSYDSVANFAVDYPKEVEASHTDPNRRTLDLFALLNVIAALGIVGFAGFLYRFSNKLLKSHTESASLPLSETTPSPLLLKPWGIALVLAALPLSILWYGYSNVLKSNFQRLCEQDGNAWHQMVPTRNNKQTSQISQKGCMTFGGSYFFADEREYGYFFAPVTAKSSLQVNPSSPVANQEASLTFSIVDDKGEPVTDLVISHGRLMHVIVVSEDFSVFNHIHPEQFGSVTAENKKAAKFDVRYAFPKAGKYIVSIDYAVRAKNFPNQFFVDVSGAPKMAGQIKDTAWQKKFGEYTVKFSTFPSGEIESGAQTVLRYEVSKNGTPVTNLQPYLGAAMHVAIAKTDLQKFLHTHGEVHPPGTPPLQQVNSAVHFHPAPPKLFGPDVEAHVVFPEPGLYQIFGEFNHEGKVIVTNFMVKVE